MTTEVIILAAGRGSRLGALTDETPKCLTELAGRPLIAWQLRALAEAGLDRVGLVTGYAADRLAHLGLPSIHNPRWEETNMVSSLLCAEAALRSEDDLIVSYGDIVYEPRIVSALRDSDGAIATVIDLDWLKLWQLRSDDPLADAESLRLDSQGRITDIGQGVASLGEIEGQYIGLTRFSAAGKRALLEFVARDGTRDWPLSSSLDDTSFTDLLRGMIDTGMTIDAIPVRGGWLEVDTPEDLAVYEAELARPTIDGFFSLPRGAAERDAATGDAATW